MKLILSLWPGALLLLPATGLFASPLAEAARQFDRDPHTTVAAVLLDARSGKLVDVYNREMAISHRFPPGSLAKPLSAVAMLELGLVPERSFLCTGEFRFRAGSSPSTGLPQSYGCWKTGGHGQMNLRRAIVHSCNVYFLKAAESMGPKRTYSRMVDRFALFDPVPGFPGSGFSRDRQPTGSSGQTATSGNKHLEAIGEGGGILLSPLKIADLYNSLYTGRTLRTPSGRILPPIAQNHRSILLGSMSRVLTEGTLQNAKLVSGGRVLLEGGKTGGATISGKKYETHGWNVILFRLDGTPMVLVSLVSPGSGAHQAADLSRAILVALR